MEGLDKIFTEKQVEELAQKVLTSTKEKIKEQIANEFYKETEGWLFELYTNQKDKIESNLIKQISEGYVKNPDAYKYLELRKKIWEENKTEIVSSLTDGAIKESLENILLNYAYRSHSFDWQWKDGIVKVILENWDKFKDDERIKNQFGRELDNRQNQIEILRKQLSEIKEIAE